MGFAREWVRSAGFGWWRWSASSQSAGQGFRDRLCCLSEAGAPEFEQVVGGCDQLPFGQTGSEAAAEEAVGAADEFCVHEDRFDDLLASTVERLPLSLREHTTPTDTSPAFAQSASTCTNVSA